MALFAIGAIVVVAAVVGVVLGIFIVAPAIWRALRRAETDEESGDRPD
jgi:hypothetical protein